jgi:hypothetical protein
VNGEVTTGNSKLISDIISLCDPDKNNKNTNLTVNNSNNKELHTIIILGDSYIRRCAESVKDNLDETCAENKTTGNVTRIRTRKTQLHQLHQPQHVQNIERTVHIYAHHINSKDFNIDFNAC